IQGTLASRCRRNWFCPCGHPVGHAGFLKLCRESPDTYRDSLAENHHNQGGFSPFALTTSKPSKSGHATSTARRTASSKVTADDVQVLQVPSNFTRATSFSRLNSSMLPP